MNKSRPRKTCCSHWIGREEIEILESARRTISRYLVCHVAKAPFPISTAQSLHQDSPSNSKSNFPRSTRMTASFSIGKRPDDNKIRGGTSRSSLQSPGSVISRYSNLGKATAVFSSKTLCHCSHSSGLIKRAGSRTASQHSAPHTSHELKKVIDAVEA